MVLEKQGNNWLFLRLSNGSIAIFSGVVIRTTGTTTSIGSRGWWFEFKADYKIYCVTYTKEGNDINT
jgi:hypothetical protein